MRLERWLAIGAATLLVAGAATGVGLAASGHGGRSSAPAVRKLKLHGTTPGAFLRAIASYLGVDVATLRHEAAERTLADIANSTPGRSERRLVSLLVAAATPQIQQVADMAMSGVQERSLRTMLRKRIVGFLNDTCSLRLGGLEKLGGCAGMQL